MTIFKQLVNIEVCPFYNFKTELSFEFNDPVLRTEVNTTHTTIG